MLALFLSHSYIYIFKEACKTYNDTFPCNKIAIVKIVIIYYRIKHEIFSNFCRIKSEF